MSLPLRRWTGVFACSLLALLLLGCTAVPPGGEFEEDRDAEARALRTELLHNRARAELKGGIVFPTNSEYEPGATVGVKGLIEAVQRGMWFTFDLEFARLDSQDPVGRGADQSTLLAAETEQLMKHFDRYQVLIGVEYDMPLGDGPYYPSFRFGLGLGGVVIDAEEAPGNQNLDFDPLYMFVAQPSLGFRFPFHENVGAFLELEYNFIPKSQMTGEDKINDRDVDIGDKVDYGSINIWAGISFEW